MIKLKIRYADNQTELSFPCTEQALQDAITAIRADPIIGPAELYVAEVIYPEELNFLQDRFANLDEVNYLAKRMRNYGNIAKDYGYKVSVIDLRNPTRSNGNNIFYLVNKYTDLYAKHPDQIAYKAKAEKYAKIISKTIILSGMDAASFGQNAYFYDAAEGLLTATILLVAEFCAPEKRHIVSVFKVIQELLAPSKKKGKNQFQQLMELLPNEHKAKWFAGAALNTAEQSMASVMSTALSRLNAFLDTELEQLLCFDTEIDAETFCNEKSAIFVIMPEENPNTFFMISLIIQQLYREILAVADENGGKLKNTYIARLTGVSYMLGILLQIANNNLVHIDYIEAGILSAFILLLAFMLIKAEKNSVVPAFSKSKAEEENNESGKDSLKIILFLVLFVALMTCIFSSMDNAVTVYHANGTVNIGQWPRILLALSGLMAGFLFDIAGRKYMSVIMYCVMLLSTTCLVIIQFAGSFTVGLIIFYLSAGFFAVFFTSSFMEIARYTDTPELWSGFGRAVNNLVAAAISGGSLALLHSENNIVMTTIELILFVATSIVALFYTNKRKVFFDRLAEADGSELSNGEKLQRLAEQFSLTQRETEVFGLLVNTEDGLQTIADGLYVSRRTLERYVSAIYEKTGAKSRIGLVTLYNNA